jgi:hypothetical protein
MSTGRAVAGLGVAAAAVMLAPLLLIGALTAAALPTLTAAAGRIDTSSLPPLAAQLLPELTELIDHDCPELPLPWAVAIADVESGWNAAAYNPTGRAAGLYQLTEPTWTGAGGAPWPATPPPPDAEVFHPDRHLQIAVPWICGNLRLVTAHIAATGKPADPLDALLVCHVAGCGRVLDSRSGIPTAGEAGCDTVCAATVRRYIADVHAVASRVTRSSGSVTIADLPDPGPFSPSGVGCTQPDPNGRGCITPTMRHTYDEITAAFGTPGPGRPIRAAGCWDPHAWNPTSDHPKGKACDLFPTRAGTFPTGSDLANGWRIATWLRAHAAALHVKYLIWQGRFWSPTTSDVGGWGEPYDQCQGEAVVRG